MKKQNKNRFRYDLVMGEEDHLIFTTLKEKYAINISKCFKIFLKKYLNKLEESNINENS